jgi:acyl-homoserine-lactone acylase
MKARTIFQVSVFLFLPAMLSAQVDPMDVTIARDSFGVPHIFGKTDAALAYGLAWAHAEDNFKDIETVLLAGKGMLGRAIGRKGAEADYVVSLLRCRDLVVDQRSRLSPAFLAVLDGYVQGLNAFALSHPEKVRIRKAFPVTVEDYLTTVTLSLSMISGLEEILPRIFSGNVETIPDMESAGSNAFAIHPSKTTTGEAYLAINSHQPLEGPVAWYEAHLQSDEGTNIIGGLFPGGPCVFLGTNEHLGWAHTVNYTDKVDLYQLRMKPGKSLEYRYNGEWQMLEMRKVKLKVKGIPVSVSKKTYWSKYGATIRTNKGTFSVRFSANQEIRGMEQWWRMNKAGNFSEFYQAISMQGLPMFNIVYADKYDTIFYISGGKMPLRNKAYNWRQTVPGDSSATLWEAFHAIGDLPQYLNPPSGYLFNTNHSPFHATAPAYDLDANQYDQTSGYETYDNNRSARFAELMADKQSLDYQTFKKIKYDNQLPMTLRYQLNIDSIAQVKQETYPDLGELISTLQQWNLESDTGSQGAALFRLLYEYASGHRKEFPNDTLTVAGAVEAFRYARQHQEQYFGRTGIALGELQQHRRGTKSLASWGLPDVLTAMYSRPQPDGRFKVMAGESYIQLVRFPRNQLPIIESINCYGASTNPGSPHFTDQMDMFIRQQTKPMTLDKETVLKQARSVYHPGLDQRKK